MEKHGGPTKTKSDSLVGAAQFEVCPSEGLPRGTLPRQFWNFVSHVDVVLQQLAVRVQLRYYVQRICQPVANVTVLAKR